MGTVTEIETDEQRAARLEQEQAALDAAEDDGGMDQETPLEGDEHDPSLREQVDAAHAAAGTSSEPDAIESVLQGTIDGGWEDIIGGKAPTSLKQRFVGGAIVMDAPAGGWKKGAIYRVETTVRYGGFDNNDVVDSETQQAVDNNMTLKLRVLGGHVIGTVEEAE